MILIISNNEIDSETDTICKLLLRKSAAFVRLNLDDFISSDCIISSTYFHYGGVQYLYSQFTKIWIRRSLNFLPKYYNNEDFDFQSIIEINIFQQLEWQKLLIFFFSKFPSEKMVNSYEGYFITKIDQLKIAEKHQLNPPASYFSNSIQKVNSLNFPIIHKPAGNLGYLVKNNFFYASFTEIISKNCAFNNFLPSFFQKKITGIFEIRLLYVDEEIYSCGMLKTTTEQNIDVKKQKLIRYSPVNISRSFKNKIKAFMHDISFKIGVIDIIKSNEGYHFIEMNPIGKFSFYSEICNFKIEERIVNLLIEQNDS